MASPAPPAVLPASVDLRHRVGPVRDQGGLNAGTAFAFCAAADATVHPPSLDRLEVAMRMSAMASSNPNAHSDVITDYLVNRLKVATAAAFDARSVTTMFRPLHAKLWRIAVLELQAECDASVEPLTEALAHVALGSTATAAADSTVAAAASVAYDLAWKDAAMRPWLTLVAMLPALAPVVLDEMHEMLDAMTPATTRATDEEKNSRSSQTSQSSQTSATGGSKGSQSAAGAAGGSAETKESKSDRHDDRRADGASGMTQDELSKCAQTKTDHIHSLWTRHLGKCTCIELADLEAFRLAPAMLDAEALAMRQSRTVTCKACNSKGTMKCSRCHRKTYCDKDCQRADWKKHKYACAPIDLGNPRVPHDLRDLGIAPIAPQMYLAIRSTIAQEWPSPDELRRHRSSVYRRFLPGRAIHIQWLLLRYDCFGFYADKVDGKPLRVTGLNEGEDGELYLEVTTAMVLSIPPKPGSASAPTQLHDGRNIPPHQIEYVTEWNAAQLELIRHSPCPEAWLLPQGFAAFLDRD